MKQRFVFLSSDFYNDYPAKDYPEIEQKQSRPYIQVITTINGVQYAIPLRSNIHHPHVFWTDKINHCGLDYSKAVVIIDIKYIDINRTPYIRPNEFKALKGKDYIIKKGMIQYIKKYKTAKNKTDNISKALCSKSTLQYFEKYI